MEDWSHTHSLKKEEKNSSEAYWFNCIVMWWMVWKNSSQACLNFSPFIAPGWSTIPSRDNSSRIKRQNIAIIAIITLSFSFSPNRDHKTNFWWLVSHLGTAQHSSNKFTEGCLLRYFSSPSSSCSLSIISPAVMSVI